MTAFKSASPFPTSSTRPNGKPIQTQTPYRLANYSKEATHAYWIGLTFNFNNFKSRPSADDSHPQKRQVIQLGQ